VKRLTPLATDPAYLDRYVAIRDKKHDPTRSQLVAAHGLVTQRYQDYANAMVQNTLHHLQPNPAAVPLTSALRACYGSPTKAL
jgi:hypothetical protein